MRKKLTLTIDPDVYDELQKLPRDVSISEVISWFLSAMMEDVKRGGMTQREFDEWIESTPKGRDISHRMKKQFGPGVRKLFEYIEQLKKTVKSGKKGKVVG
jgi:predicted CopG family antitoxin